MKNTVCLIAVVIVAVSALMCMPVLAYTAPDAIDFNAETEAAAIEYSVNKQAVIYCNAVDNTVLIDGDKIKKEFDEAKINADDCIDALSKKGLSLNRNLEICVTVVVEGLDLSDFASVVIDQKNIKKILDVDNVKIILDQSNEYISLTSETLKSSNESYMMFRADVKKISDTYTVRFLDWEGVIIERLPSDIKLGLPAVSRNQTVYLYKENTQENWGGQFNNAEGSIEVMTKYTGEYNVASPDIVIRDVDRLSDYEQAAIMFMTVRGYFELDNEKFRPYDTLTRYEFAQSLVRMYFALDDRAVCTFPDVNEDSEYYRYIAASQQSAIVDGFEDGTFKGAIDVTVEQVLAQASRTIINKNGYIYPEQLDLFLDFEGAKGISDWAKKEVALAVREGIYDSSMDLDFGKSISRKDAAVILYRLFMIMNNTPKISVVADSDEGKEWVHNTIWSFTTMIVTIVVTSIVSAVCLIVCILTVKRKNQKQNRNC